MADPPERTANTLNDLLDVVREVGAAATTDTIWFRGVRNAAHSLTPRLYRDGRAAGDLIALERDMQAQFKARSAPLIGHTREDAWGYMFIMQHYGVPTRLLDWSENALLAAYFALSQAAARDFDTDAVIWILDPAGWNLATFPGMDEPGNALHADSADLENYEPGREVNAMAEGVAAMHPLYNNPRIAAQRGVFTVFGREKMSMEDIFDSENFAEPLLTRVVLPQADLEDMNRQIRILGFRESMIYPDLTGLADEIRIGQGLA